MFKVIQRKSGRAQTRPGVPSFPGLEHFSWPRNLAATATQTKTVPIIGVMVKWPLVFQGPDET